MILTLVLLLSAPPQGEDTLSEHARQHAEMAAGLREFGEGECSLIAEEARPQCPFSGPLSVELVDLGVRVRVQEAVRLNAMLDHMRCHALFARTLSEPRLPCPLYLMGITIRRSPDGRGIDLVAPDVKTLRLLRATSDQSRAATTAP